MLLTSIRHKKINNFLIIIKYLLTLSKKEYTGFDFFSTKPRRLHSIKIAFLALKFYESLVLGTNFYCLSISFWNRTDLRGLDYKTRPTNIIYNRFAELKVNKFILKKIDQSGRYKTILLLFYSRIFHFFRLLYY